MNLNSALKKQLIQSIFCQLDSFLSLKYLINNNINYMNILILIGNTLSVSK